MESDQFVPGVGYTYRTSQPLIGFWSFTICFAALLLWHLYSNGVTVALLPLVLLLASLLWMLERVSYAVKIDASGDTLSWRSPLRSGTVAISSIDCLYIDRWMGGLAMFRGPKPRLFVMESHSSEFDDFISVLASLRSRGQFEVIDRRPAERVRTTGFKTYFGPSER